MTKVRGRLIKIALWLADAELPVIAACDCRVEFGHNRSSLDSSAVAAAGRSCIVALINYINLCHVVLFA